MDRWSGREEDDGAPKGPQGRVARLGIGAFVKKDSGAHPAASAFTDIIQAHAKQQVLDTDGTSAPDGVLSTGSGTVEVVASRRQQKQAQAAAAMPPPPAKLGKQPVAPSSSVPAPDWVGKPPAGFYLEVQKSGEPVQQIELNTPCTLFGRSADADVVLDHASISRQHALVCYHRESNKWFVVDQGSAHGTFVNGEKAVKGVPTPITAAAGKVLFGASTRLYILSLNEGSSARKRGAHEEIERPTKQAKIDGAHALPQAAESTKGQFADVIKTEVRPAQINTGHGAPTPSRSQPVTVQHAPARTKPEFQKFMSGHLKRPPAFGQGSSLYDALPPEKTNSTH